MQNGALIAAAESSGFDGYFLTTDKSLKYQQNLVGTSRSSFYRRRVGLVSARWRAKVLQAVSSAPRLATTSKSRWSDAQIQRASASQRRGVPVLTPP